MVFVAVIDAQRFLALPLSRGGGLAQKTIGYHPSTSLEEGLKKTWQWYIGHPQEYMQKICHFEEEQNQTPIVESRDTKPNYQQPMVKG